MKKSEFLTRINYEDKVLLSNIYDKILLHNKIDGPVYTNEFYAPNIWNCLEKLSGELGCKVNTYGVFKESERRSIAILDMYDEENIYNYPIELIRIDNMSSFNVLKHGDFLGALMNQGIKREKLGDLILDGNSCYVPICTDICGFIKENLTKIGKNPCKIVSIDLNCNEIPSYKFDKKNITVTSMRIDCVISSLCGVSRNISCEMIKKGLVLLNYEKIFEKNVSISVGSIITIRGYGKFKIEGYLGETLKKRRKIAVKKYI